MYIDYITLMLINMAGGLAVLGLYVLLGVDKEQGKTWGVALMMAGVVGLVTGLCMSMTWPIPDLSAVEEGSSNLRFANVAFGEMSVLLGVLLLGGGAALMKKWSLWPLTIYAFVAGVVAMVIGIRLWGLRLTTEPAMAGIGFILTGLCGVLSGPFLWVRKRLAARVLAAVIILAAAVLWTITALGAYWVHLKNFS